MIIDFSTSLNENIFSGCRIISVAPGTKLVSKNVTYSTTQRTGLTVGCYRVKEPDKAAERILVIKDDQNGGDPVVGKAISFDFSHTPLQLWSIGCEQSRIQIHILFKY